MTTCIRAVSPAFADDRTSRISEEREERRRDEAVRQRREAAQLEELLQTALSGTPR